MGYDICLRPSFATAIPTGAIPDTYFIDLVDRNYGGRILCVITEEHNEIGNLSAMPL